MAVIDKTKEMSAEEAKEQAKQQSKKEMEVGDEISEDLISSLDLPEDQEGSEKKEESKSKQGDDVDGKEVSSKKSLKDVEKDLSEEELDEAVEDEEEEEDQGEIKEDEEMIPASKLKKRLESERIKRAELESRIRTLEAGKSSPTSDAKQKLESMDQSQLKELRRNVRSELRIEEDSKRQEQLEGLLDDIYDVIQTIPQRFQQRQYDLLNEGINRIKSDESYDHIDFEKHGSAIEKLGEKILAKHPRLSKLEDGLVIAMEQAVERYSNALKASKGESRVKEVKRKFTKLKQKTSLDSSTVKGDQKTKSIRKLYDKAKDPKSGIEEKAEFMENLIDVDQFLDPQHKGR